MRILVDENIPRCTVQALVAAGHDVTDVRGTSAEGVPDEVLWSKALREHRTLVTTDKGFGRYREQTHHGLLIICLAHPNRHEIHQRVMQAINEFSPEKWPGLMVVMRDRVKSVWYKRDSD